MELEPDILKDIQESGASSNPVMIEVSVFSKAGARPLLCICFVMLSKIYDSKTLIMLPRARARRMRIQCSPQAIGPIALHFSNMPSKCCPV